MSNWWPPENWILRATPKNFACISCVFSKDLGIWGLSYPISNFRNDLRSQYLSPKKQANKQTKQENIPFLSSSYPSYPQTDQSWRFSEKNSGRGAPPRSLRVNGIGESIDGIGLPTVELVQHGVMAPLAPDSHSFLDGHRSFMKSFHFHLNIRVSYMVLKKMAWKINNWHLIWMKVKVWMRNATCNNWIWIQKFPIRWRTNPQRY